MTRDLCGAGRRLTAAASPRHPATPEALAEALLPRIEQGYGRVVEDSAGLLVAYRPRQPFLQPARPYRYGDPSRAAWARLGAGARHPDADQAATEGGWLMTVEACAERARREGTAA